MPSSRRRHPLDDDNDDVAGADDDHRRAFRLSADGPLWAWLEGLPERQAPGPARRESGAPFTCVGPGGVLLHLPGPVEDPCIVARCVALQRLCGGGTRFCPETGVLRAGRLYHPVPRHTHVRAGVRLPACAPGGVAAVCTLSLPSRFFPHPFWDGGMGVGEKKQSACVIMPLSSSRAAEHEEGVAPGTRKRGRGAVGGRPSSAATAAAADGGGGEDNGGDPVEDNAAHFGLRWEDLHAFVRHSARSVTDFGFFDDDQAADRFVIVSVDPAGGGVLSEEAFVVFLVCGGRFGLLTGRMVPGHNQRYGFSMVPLVFVLSLLHTVNAVKGRLEHLHRAALRDGNARRRRGRRLAPAFTMPPVLVLIENNFAYGAATYMQMLWFLRQRQRNRSSAAEEVLDIVFATPVYGLDPLLLARYTELRTLQRRLRAVHERRQEARDAVRAAWLEERGRRRRRGMNLSRFLQTVNRALQREAKDVLEEDAADEVVDTRQASVLDASDADARQAATILADMVGEAFDDDEEREHVLQNWAAQGGSMVRSVAAQAAVRRHEQALAERARRVQRDIDGHLARHADREHHGQHEFVRLSPIPPGHTLDTAAPGQDLRAEPHALWDAGKRLIGEWTQEAQKVLAFRQFVALARRPSPSPYFAVLLTLDDAGGGRDGDPSSHGPAPAPCAHPHLRSSDHEQRPMVDGVQVLNCVYQQWRQLAVWVHPDDPRLPVRVVGKQPVRAADAAAPGKRRHQAQDHVHKDDMWMAFAIGLQWCTRFTQLLPSAAHRAALVGYMRQLRQTMERTLQHSLRDADAGEAGGGGGPQDPAEEQEVGGHANNANASAPLPSSVPPPLSDPERDATIVCTAFASAALRVCTACVALVRRLVLAYAVHGYRPSAGWSLAFTERRLAPAGALSQRTWHEALNQQLLRFAEPSAVADRLAEVQRMFAVPVHTVRLVCGTLPGPRYAWPGVTLPRDAHQPPPSGRRPMTDPADVVAALARLVALLRRAVGACEERHASHHPVLSTPETRHLLGLLLQRIAGQVGDLQALLVVPDGVLVWPTVDAMLAVNRCHTCVIPIIW